MSGRAGLLRGREVDRGLEQEQEGGDSQGAVGVVEEPEAGPS